MQTLELKIPPPLVALVMALIMWLFSKVLPAVSIPQPLRVVTAAACAGFGVLVAILGVWALRQAKTTLNPVNPEKASAIVTGGIYNFSRNPMYLGLTAVLLGWAIWLSVLWLFLGPVVLALYLTRFQIVPEERVMSSKFGRDYDDYRRHARRWL